MRERERESERAVVETRGMPMPPLCTLQGCCNLPYLVGGLASELTPIVDEPCHPPGATHATLSRWKFYESWNLVWRNERLCDGEREGERETERKRDAKGGKE